MARAIGPIFSEAASGSLADLLTYQTASGRHSIRKTPKPKGSATRLQLSVRALIKYCPKLWATLTTIEKAPWIAAGKLHQMTGQDWMRKQWHILRLSNLGPSWFWPIPAGVITGTPIVTSTTVLAATVTFVINYLPTFGVNQVAICEGASGFTATPQNAILWLKDQPSPIVLTNVTKGTHFYRLLPCKNNGRLGNATAQQTATIP